MAQVDEVRFTNVRVASTAVLGGTEGQGWETLEAAALQAIPVLCAYQVGSCQSVFDMAVAYSRTCAIWPADRAVPACAGPHHQHRQ